MTEQKTRQEEFEVSGAEIISKIKEVFHEGKAREIIIKNEAGEQIAQFPLYAGLAGIVLVPILAFAGTLVALATSCTIVVVKNVEEETPAEAPKG